MVRLSILHCDGLVGIHLSRVKRLTRVEASHCSSLKAVRFDDAFRLHSLTVNFCAALEKIGPLGERDGRFLTSVNTASRILSSTDSRDDRKKSLPFERLRFAEFNGARSLPESFLHRFVDHCRELRRLSIIGACEGAGNSNQRVMDQKLKANLKGKGRRHKNGNSKEVGTRARAKTANGLKALGEKRPGTLTVIRSKKDLSRI